MNPHGNLLDSNGAQSSALYQKAAPGPRKLDRNAACVFPWNCLVTEQSLEAPERERGTSLPQGSSLLNQRPLASIDGPHPTDKHVGAKMRARRMEIGMSQDRLAAALKVASQQVQKYESAANRISASRLFEIAELLDVPASYFFDGLSSKRGVDDPDLSAEIKAALAERDCLQLVEAFARLETGPVRRHLVDLICAMVAGARAEATPPSVNVEPSRRLRHRATPRFGRG